MKQKIIISLPVSTDKCRALAMKTAVSTKGVKLVDIVEEKNHLVVNGEGIDSFILMKKLKKKFRCAEILTIEEVKSKEKKKKKDGSDDEDEDKKKKVKCEICPFCCKPPPCPCKFCPICCKPPPCPCKLCPTCCKPPPCSCKLCPFCCKPCPCSCRLCPYCCRPWPCSCRLCPLCCRPYPCICIPCPPYPVYQSVYDQYSQICSIV